MRRSNRDAGSSLVLAVGVVGLVGALVAGVSAAVASAARTDAALREGRDRRFAAEGVLRQAMATLGRLDAPCTASPMVGLLNGIVVRVDPSPQCRLVADGGGVVLDRAVRLRACVVQEGSDPEVVDDLLGRAPTGRGPWRFDELSPGTAVSGCSGSFAVEAEIDIVDVGPDRGDGVLRSWSEVGPGASGT